MPPASRLLDPLCTARRFPTQPTASQIQNRFTIGMDYDIFWIWIGFGERK